MERDSFEASSPKVSKLERKIKISESGREALKALKALGIEVSANEEVDESRIKRAFRDAAKQNFVQTGGDATELGGSDREKRENYDRAVAAKELLLEGKKSDFFPEKEIQNETEPTDTKSNFAKWSDPFTEGSREETPEMKKEAEKRRKQEREAHIKFEKEQSKLRQRRADDVAYGLGHRPKSPEQIQKEEAEKAQKEIEQQKLQEEKRLKDEAEKIEQQKLKEAQKAEHQARMVREHRERVLKIMGGLNKNP